MWFNGISEGTFEITVGAWCIGYGYMYREIACFVHKSCSYSAFRGALDDGPASMALIGARSSTHPFRCEVYGKWLHMWLAAHENLLLVKFFGETAIGVLKSAALRSL